MLRLILFVGLILSPHSHAGFGLVGPKGRSVFFHADGARILARYCPAHVEPAADCKSTRSIALPAPEFLPAIEWATQIPLGEYGQQQRWLELHARLYFQNDRVLQTQYETAKAEHAQIQEFAQKHGRAAADLVRAKELTQEIKRLEDKMEDQMMWAAVHWEIQGATKELAVALQSQETEIFSFGNEEHEIQAGLLDGFLQTDPAARPQFVPLPDTELSVSRTQLSQLEWFRVMRTAPAAIKSGENCSRITIQGHTICPALPVTNVSVEEIRQYLQKLNEIRTDYLFRLPTETEWERYTLAGQTPESLNLRVDGRGKDTTTHPASEILPANAWGICPGCAETVTRDDESKAGKKREPLAEKIQTVTRGNCDLDHRMSSTETFWCTQNATQHRENTSLRLIRMKRSK